MKKYLLVCFMLIFTFAFSGLFAQDRTVTGHVTSSEDGTDLPGVNVILKGTATGTVTDISGNYSLSVPAEGGTLVFSFVGLQTIERSIGTSSVVDVELVSDIKQLSEVIVTAQGIEKTKNELTYAAQRVDGEDVSMSRSGDAISNLAGRVSGVDVKSNNIMGGSSNIVIRGSASIFNNNQALYIVDGVPIDNTSTNTSGSRSQTTGRGGYDYGSPVSDINPDDIESINVLKGAAATALYGSRASNGVIYITTKKGRSRKGIGVTLNAGVTVGTYDKSTFAKYQDKYGAGYGAGFYAGDIDGDGSADDRFVQTDADASYGSPFDPSLQVYQWDAFYDFLPSYHTSRPWLAAENGPEAIFETSVAQNYSVFLDGKSDKGYFKVGYTRNDQKGILPNSELTKDFVNFSGAYEVAPKLTITSSINFTGTEALGRYGTGYDDKNLMTNFRQWWEVNVDVSEQEDAYNRGNGINPTWNIADPRLPPKAIFWDNPYFTRNENYENDSRLRYFGYTSMNYEATDWLSITGRISLDSYSVIQEERQAIGSTTTSGYRRFNKNFREYNYDLFATLKKKVSDNLMLSGIIGTNTSKRSTESIFVETNGGLVLPGLYSVSNSANALNPPIEEDINKKVFGYYINGTATYKDMLTLDAAFRVDQSSTLPETKNKYPYGQVSAGFTFSELTGTSPLFTFGKIRGSYAEVGNDTQPYNLQDVYTNTVSFGGVPKYSVNGTKNNPDLKPERTKSYEIGLEMTFFDGRLGLDASYYNAETFDQIFPIPIARSTGYNSKIVNAGRVRNNGFELTVYATPVRSDNFNWNITANWTRNRNKVLELTEGIDVLQLASYQGGVSVNAPINEPNGIIRGRDFLFNENGEKIVNSEGAYKFSTTSNEVIGDTNPDWLAGITNKFTYKDISLSFLIDVRQGGDLFNLDLYYGLATGLYPETAFTNDLGNPVRSPLDEGGGLILPGVKEDGTPNDIRRDANGFSAFGYSAYPASNFVYDGSYIKLREVALTYSLPRALIEKLGPLNGIDLSLVGRNLWIIHKNIPYADPEDNLSSGNLANGYQSGTYPSVRTMGFNVRVKF